MNFSFRNGWPPMRSAVAYERRGMIFVHGSSKTADGIWILSEPVSRVDASDISRIGASIRECLAGSRIGVPHPKVFANLFAPILTLAKTRSYQDFIRNAKCVEIVQEGSVIRFNATKNGGVDEGFSQIGVSKECADAETDEHIGHALIQIIRASV